MSQVFINFFASIKSYSDARSLRIDLRIGMVTSPSIIINKSDISRLQSTSHLKAKVIETATGVDTAVVETTTVVDTNVAETITVVETTEI